MERAGAAAGELAGDARGGGARAAAREVAAHAAVGLAIGALLAGARASAGPELLDLPVASAAERYGARAAGIGVVALACALARGWSPRTITIAALVAGALGGWLTTILLVLPWTGRGAIVPVAAGAVVVVAALLARRRHGRSARTPNEPMHAESAAALAALALLGAAAAIALERIAMHVRLFGAGIELDAAVLGGSFLALVAIGALALGPLPRALARAHGDARALAAVLALVPLLACFGFGHVRALASLPGLEHHLRSIERWLPVDSLDSSLHGTWLYGVAIAVPILITPAFALGAALGAARRRAELAAILAGAAAALAAYPWIFAYLAGRAPLVGGERELVLVAALAIAAVALLLVPGARTREIDGARTREITAARARERIGPAVLAALLALFAWRVPMSRVVVLSPWGRAPVAPDLAIETWTGLLTVESAGPARIATLDRRALTPPPELHGAEAQRIAFSIERLAPERASGARVLLVGQLSPERAAELVARGVALVDRTGAWHAWMEPIEAALFAHARTAPPAGEILAPREARRRLRAGAYDLVLVPPLAGDPPRDAPLPDAGADTVAVVWLDGSGALFASALPPRGLVSADAFEGLAVGVVLGASARIDARSPVLPLGPARARGETLRWLALRTDERARRARALFAARLSDAARGTAREDLARGLALHYAAQRASSPFETREQRVELDAAALEALARAAVPPARDDTAQNGATPNAASPNDAAPNGAPHDATPHDASSLPPLDDLTRATWNGIAHLLAAKREVELVQHWLAPLAAARAPWPELELALAEADLESLEPERAIARLAPVVPETGADPRLVWMLARARSARGEHALAAELLERIAASGAAWRELPRALAIERFLAGDPHARASLEEIARADPDDLLVRRLLDEGPAEDDGGFGARDPWEGLRGG